MKSFTKTAIITGAGTGTHTVSAPAYAVVKIDADTFTVARKSGGSAVDVTSAGTGTHTFTTQPTAPSNCTIRDCDFDIAPSLDAINFSSGLDNRILDCKFTAGGLDFAEDEPRGNIVRGCIIPGGISSTAVLTRAGLNYITGNLPSSRFGRVQHLLDNAIQIAETTASYEVAACSIPANNTIIKGDGIEFEVEAFIPAASTNGTKDFRIVITINTAANTYVLTPTAGQTGALLIRGRVVFTAADSANYRIDVDDQITGAGRTITNAFKTGNDLNTYGITISVRGWVANAADSIWFTKLRSRVIGNEL